MSGNNIASSYTTTRTLKHSMVAFIPSRYQTVPKSATSKMRAYYNSDAAPQQRRWIRTQSSHEKLLTYKLYSRAPPMSPIYYWQLCKRTDDNNITAICWTTRDPQRSIETHFTVMLKAHPKSGTSQITERLNSDAAPQQRQWRRTLSRCIPNNSHIRNQLRTISTLMDIT